MRYRRIVFALLAAASLAACTTTQTSTASYGRYEEDLSVYRRNVPVPERPVVERKLDSIPSDSAETELAQNIAASLEQDMPDVWNYRLNKGKVAGYTIQLYNGGSREKAEANKALCYKVNPDSRPQLKFNAPNWRLTVGTYYSEMEALKDLYAYREELPTALLVGKDIWID